MDTFETIVGEEDEASESSFKIGYGQEQNMESALVEGKIDSGDIIVTSDTNKISFINPDGNVIPIRTVDVFDSIENATTYINSSPTVYVGMQMIIQDGEFCYQYTVIKDEFDSFKLQPITPMLTITEVE